MDPSPHRRLTADTLFWSNGDMAWLIYLAIFLVLVCVAIIALPLLILMLVLYAVLFVALLI